MRKTDGADVGYPRHPRDRILGVIEIVILVSVGLFLYGDSVTLPFFFDDILHIFWVEGNSLWGLWTGAASLGHYRPLASALWKLSLLFTGTFNAPLLHGINVALHILNGALVAALTRRVLTRWILGGLKAIQPSHYRLTGLVAGVLFLSYPFSYQAVPWVGALFHPLVTSLVLGAVLTGLKARSASWWGWRALSLGMTIAAFFTHETGLTIGAWLLGYELTFRDDDEAAQRRWRVYLWPLAYLALGVAYLGLYFSVPRGGDPPPLPTRDLLIQNGAYLLQGLAFPIAPLTRWTMDGWGWNDLSAAYLAAGLTVGLLVSLSWRQRMLRALGFALICFTLSVIPVWLTLPFIYMISGPRLLYLASVGAAIGWACGFQALACLGRGQWRALTSGLSLLLIGLTVVFCCRFVRVGQAVHRLGGDLIWQMSEIVAATPEDERLLVVNYPAWLSPHPLVYPVGHEGVEFMPRYTAPADLAWANSGVRREIQTAKFANTLVELEGLYCGVRGPDVGWEGLAQRLRAADQVYAVHYTPEALDLVQVGRLANGCSLSATPSASTMPSDWQPIGAVFDDRVTLVAVETATGSQSASADEQTRTDAVRLTLRLIWQSEGPLTDADYRIFAHLYDESGALITQSDGYPMDGLYPFWLWLPGEQIEENRYFTLGCSLSAPASQHSGYYRIAIGIYDGASGERLPAFTPDGTHFADDAVPIPDIRWPGD